MLSFQRSHMQPSDYLSYISFMKVHKVRDFRLLVIRPVPIKLNPLHKFIIYFQTDVSDMIYLALSCDLCNVNSISFWIPVVYDKIEFWYPILYTE